MKTLLCISAVFVAMATAQERSVQALEMPGTNLPIQVIGANDLVAVVVYDAPEFTRTVRVGADGFIRLPMLQRRVRAAGLLPDALESAIADALKAEQLIVEPFVTVTVAEYHSRPISVAGSVKRPLTFQAAGPVTLLDALARAEGLSPEAGPDILLSRPSRGGDGSTMSLTQRIPVKDLIGGADPEANVKLQGGEEIRIPEAGRFFVLVNVKKPGAFSAHDGPDTTVLKALSLAEGLAPYPGKIAYIYRREASGSKQEIPIDLTKIMQRKSPDVALMSNDILYITDAKGTRAGLAVLEKVLLFGGGAMSALIYAGIR
jgi:polysaccharide export outer membrane protein